MSITLTITCDGRGCEESAHEAGPSAPSLERLEAAGWVAQGKYAACPRHAAALLKALAARKPQDPAPKKSPPSKHIEVCSDGSCVGANPGYGAWGWAASDGRVESGPADEHPTTNQRMEIMAAAEALEAFPSGEVTLFTDSQYVANCVNKGWYKGWRKRGWMTSGKAPVKHQDQWERLIAAYEANGRVTVQWVKGHSDHALNVQADEAANREARTAMARLKGGASS